MEKQKQKKKKKKFYAAVIGDCFPWPYIKVVYATTEGHARRKIESNGFQVGDVEEAAVLEGALADL